MRLLKQESCKKKKGRDSDVKQIMKKRRKLQKKRSEHYEKNKVLILANKNGSYKSNKKKLYQNLRF